MLVRQSRNLAPRSSIEEGCDLIAPLQESEAIRLTDPFLKLGSTVTRLERKPVRGVSPSVRFLSPGPRSPRDLKGSENRWKNLKTR